MKATNILKTLLIFFICVQGVAQEGDKTYPVTLETVLQLAGTNSLKIKEFQAIHEMAIAEHKAAQEWWLPTVYFGVMMHKLNGAAMNTDEQIFTDVDRQNFWGGVGANLEWDLGEGIYRALATKQKSLAAQYKTQADRNKAMLEVIEAYLELQGEQVKHVALEQLTKKSQQIVDQVKLQVEIGSEYKSQLYLAQSNHNHTEIALKQSFIDLHKKSARLVNLLNLENDITLVVADSVLAPIELVKDSINLTESRNTAYSKRPEVLGLERSLQSAIYGKKTATTALLLPSIRLGTYNAYFGEPFSPLYNTWELNMAVLWDIPLGHLFYGGKKKQYNARIALNEIQLEQVKNQVDNELSDASMQVKISKQQLELAQESLKLSKEALDQSMERQKVRTAKPYEVFQAQEYYLRGQVDYIDAIRNYNQAQYKLHVALGNNL